MATYQELFDLRRNQELLDKITVAIIIAAQTIFDGDDTTDPPWDQTNNANRLIWAREASLKPRQMAEVFMPAVLAANKDAAPTAISGATDATIQSNINATVDQFADGSAVLS